MEDEMDELMLPGFRFHPTDEELVGFYLRRKIQNKPLSIELIKQLDIYKYDPWDLQKLAATGEKEWYFYCPRDRKYRNSPRPNRVTEAGFWKATGTDRPIYSSQGSKVCIGLKKSLVFYKGRAAKGIKTDWMMHEFRLPSSSDSLSARRCLDKNIPANEAWAICRIFKKANSSAQKAITHSWVPPVFDANTISSHHILNPNFSNLSEDSNQLTSPSSSQLFGFRNDAHHSSQLANFFSPKPLCPLSQPSTNHSNSGHQETLNNPTLLSSPTVTSEPKCAINDASSLLLDMSNSVLGDSRRGSSDSTVGGFGPLHDQHEYGFSMSNFQENHGQGSDAVFVKGQDLVQIDDPMLRPVMGLHYGLGDVWKWSSLLLDSSPCPVAEFSTGFSTNNYYT